MSATKLVNPQSLNLYSYVANNPIDFVDPTGLYYEIVCERWSWFDKETGEEVGPRFWKCEWVWIPDFWIDYAGRRDPPRDGLGGGGYTDTTPKNDPDGSRKKKISDCFQSKLKTINAKYKNDKKNVGDNAKIQAAAATATAWIWIGVGIATGNIVMVVLALTAYVIALAVIEAKFRTDIEKADKNYAEDVEGAFNDCVRSVEGTRTDGKDGPPL